MTPELQQDESYHKTPSPRLYRPDMLRQILRRRRAPRRQDREVATLMKSLLRRRAPPRQERQVATLILLRHGQSVWNLENLFTGWYDAPLTELGEHEARTGGELLLELREQVCRHVRSGVQLDIQPKGARAQKRGALSRVREVTAGLSSGRQLLGREEAHGTLEHVELQATAPDLVEDVADDDEGPDIVEEFYEG